MCVPNLNTTQKEDDGLIQKQDICVWLISDIQIQNQEYIHTRKKECKEIPRRDVGERSHS